MHDQAIKSWVANMPKAELHLHIDGSLQAHRLLSLAKKHGVELPYRTLDDVEAAYQFEDLQSFLDLYYLGASVLRDESDFYHLMMDYLLKCREQNIVHAEIMVEPQSYFPNGVDLETVVNGFNRAIQEAEQGWGQSVLLILSFLRHLSEESAMETLEEAKPLKEHFSAIGLASSEAGNPPEKFLRLFQSAIEMGFRTVAHAGEEGPPEFVWSAIDALKVDRVDHGVRAIEDDGLMSELCKRKIPLTVCPLSNVRLCVFDDMKEHDLMALLEKGLIVTINSDDPAYFGGYMNENFFAVIDAFRPTKKQLMTVNKNSFRASFLPEHEKSKWLIELDKYN